jgi:hypothetical protein
VELSFEVFGDGVKSCQCGGVFQDIGVICEVSQTGFRVLDKMRSQFENSPHEGNEKRRRRDQISYLTKPGLQGSLIPSFGFGLPGLLILFIKSKLPCQNKILPIF